jgi:hypothetical protein
MVENEPQLLTCPFSFDVENVYKQKIAVKPGTMLFTKKINGIILGDMTRPAVCRNPWYSEAYYKGVLMYWKVSKHV